MTTTEFTKGQKVAFSTAGKGGSTPFRAGTIVALPTSAQPRFSVQDNTVAEPKIYKCWAKQLRAA